MLTVENAKKILLKNIPVLNSAGINVSDSTGYILAEDIYSPFDLPLFDNSAMDGYAIRFSDFQKGKPLKVIGEIRAGDSGKYILRKNEAVRIFTGAKIPKGADTVVMQEICDEKNNSLFINDKILEGENIRRKGNEVRKGTKILKAGIKINSAIIGLCSTLGIKKVKVIRKPRVSVIVTGSELMEPGRKLSEGKIYNSNSPALKSALLGSGIEKPRAIRVKDSEKKISTVLRRELEISDALIFSGGISVGKYDFVKNVLNKIGVRKIFYKVAQKPGKPLFAGKKGKKIFFGLPGNPAASLVCFYEYVLPSLKKMTGYPEDKIDLEKQELTLLNDVRKKSGRSHFMRGKIFDGKVLVFDKQDSSMLTSFAHADCLVYVPQRVSHLKKRTFVEVHLLPQ